MEAKTKRIANRMLEDHISPSAPLVNRRVLEIFLIINCPPWTLLKQKSHRQFCSGGGILEWLAMILEYLAPSARRRTHTAGTTEAGLLGLLDVGNHEIRVLKPPPDVNLTLVPNVGSKGTSGLSQRFRLGFRLPAVGSTPIRGSFLRA